MTGTGTDKDNQNDQNPVVNGRFRLKVSSDKLSVYMEGLQAPSGGGKPVSAKQVHNKLKKMDVKYGVDNNKIDKILTALNEGRLPAPKIHDQGPEKPEAENPASKNIDNNHLCIAKGNAPIHGKHASLGWKINNDETPGYVAIPGEVIAEYHPSTTGEAGTSVFGKTLSAQPGRNETIKAGNGIEQSSNDGATVYQAQWYGTIQTGDNMLSINCLLNISDDNMSAALDLRPPSSKNKPLELEHIITTLTHHKITFGIKEKGLADALKTLNETREPIDGFIVAEGTPVIEGADAGIKWHIDKNKITEGNYIIRPGELIATCGPNTAGTPGTDILGNTIPTIPGKDMPLKTGNHITEDENSHEWHAEALGVLNYTELENNAEISIDPGLNVTDDAMEGRFNLFKISSDGRAINISDITRSLKACGINSGINETAIREAFESADNSDTDPIKDVLVAQGKTPKDGIDAHIIYSQKENIGGQELSRGRVDVHEHNSLWSFKKDDIIGNIIKAVPEEDGFNVWGEVTKAKPAETMQLELEGAHIDEHNKIIADIDGMLIINGLHLILTDLSVIDGDVSQKTGNIHSTTSVHVKGHVEPGFVLESDKCIVIEKNVEDAIVRAGGSITIKGGIRGIKSEVYTPDTVNVQFVENADVFVNGDITITGSVINSKVSSNNAITVGNKKSRHSAIIGGRLTAHNHIEANTLGSSAYRKTIVSVGFTQEIKQQQRDLKKDIESKENDITQLEQIKAHNKSHPMPDTEDALLKVNAIQETLRDGVKNLTEQLNTVMAQLEQSKNVKIVVHNQVFPGVTIKINDHIYPVNKETNGGTFTLENNRVIFTPK